MDEPYVPLDDLEKQTDREYWFYHCLTYEIKKTGLDCPKEIFVGLCLSYSLLSWWGVSRYLLNLIETTGFDDNDEDRQRSGLIVKLTKITRIMRESRQERA